MSDMPPPPPDDSSWSSPPPPPPGPASQSPQTMTGWAAIGTGGTVELAGAGRRLGARILDAVIMLVAVLILFAVGIAAALGVDSEDWTEENSAAVTGTFIGFALLAVAIGILYEVTLIATRGQTLGKMAARIKVVRADNGLAPGWGKSIVRWIIPAVLGFIPVVGWILSLLVYVSLLWDKVRQGWHDKAAGTLVVKA